jgi:cytochrome oxidase Cu insertion factor (SCO1/SenC/PrrC family)
MSEVSMTESLQKKGGRKILLMLGVIFILPFTIAATLHLLNLKPTGHSYGNLVQPPKPLNFTIIQDAQGKEIKPDQWLKKWSVVTLDSTNCAEPCQADMHLLKQINTSLNKDAHRLQRVIIMPTEPNADVISQLQKRYPELVILAGTSPEIVKFSSQFNVADGHIYLIDPLGNLMMSYPKIAEPKGVRKDLMRLLKNSWAG